LAGARAEAAAQYLISQGTSANRVKTDTAAASPEDGGAQAVSFVVGQVPY
jgi:hypothetical protein